jgi:hypothetical protein
MTCLAQRGECHQKVTSSTLVMPSSRADPRRDAGTIEGEDQSAPSSASEAPEGASLSNYSRA